MRTTRYAIASLAVIAITANTARAQAITLDEPVTDTRVYRVQQVMKLTGTLKTPLPDGKSLPLKLEGEAAQSFRQRRLAGTGRDAKALRTIRNYTGATLNVTVGGEKSRKKLAATSRLMVVHGGDAGLTIHSLSGPLTFDDLELLRMPGDNLAVLAFLPPDKVLAGQSWAPPGWAIQLLTGIDAVAKSSVTCKLKSADAKTATVTISGKLEGARDGAPTKLTLDGEYTYNLTRGFIQAVTLKQIENSAAGPISPALDVTAEIRIARSIAGDDGPLSAEAVGRIPLEPKDELFKVRLEPSAHAHFLVDRDWHVVHQTRELTILRLLREGNLIAQVNIKPLADAAAGKHVPEEKFQGDIAAALGARLKAVKKAEQIKPKDAADDDRYLYRVIVDGMENGVDMQWTYYLCAAPSGRQVSLVFAVEKKLVGKLDDADIGFVLGIRFPVEKTANR